MNKKFKINKNKMIFFCLILYLLTLILFIKYTPHVIIVSTYDT